MSDREEKNLERRGMSVSKNREIINELVENWDNKIDGEKEEKRFREVKKKKRKKEGVNEDRKENDFEKVMIRMEKNVREIIEDDSNRRKQMMKTVKREEEKVQGRYEKIMIKINLKKKRRIMKIMKE